MRQVTAAFSTRRALGHDSFLCRLEVAKAGGDRRARHIFRAQRVIFVTALALLVWTLSLADQAVGAPACPEVAAGLPEASSETARA